MTVLEALKAFKEVTGKTVNFKIGPRREGDIAAIYSDSHKAKEKLQWEPQFNIKDMMKSAWEWQKNLNKNHE